MPYSTLQGIFTKRGAENETRTRDPDLGKVVLYQLSYFRSISKIRSRGTGLQRYGKNPNLQIFLWFFEGQTVGRPAFLPVSGPAACDGMR